MLPGGVGVAAESFGVAFTALVVRFPPRRPLAESEIAAIRRGESRGGGSHSPSHLRIRQSAAGKVIRGDGNLRVVADEQGPLAFALRANFKLRPAKFFHAEGVIEIASRSIDTST